MSKFKNYFDKHYKRAGALARSMMNNDMTEFWKDVKKNTNPNVSLATNVDGSVGDTEIAEMWKCHYISLLNSVQNEEFKKSVMLNINQQHESSITITPFNSLDALKSIKFGKSSSVDGISAEHFVYCLIGIYNNISTFQQFQCFQQLYLR